MGKKFSPKVPKQSLLVITTRVEDFGFNLTPEKPTREQLRGLTLGKTRFCAPTELALRPRM